VDVAPIMLINEPKFTILLISAIIDHNTNTDVNKYAVVYLIKILSSYSGVTPKGKMQISKVKFKIHNILVL
jgi:hypothetical protein